jgi:hypothetical protein
MDNKILYVIDVDDRSSTDVLNGVEFLAFLSPEQAWGQGNPTDVVFALEDRGGEMIPREFILRNVHVIRRV